MEILIVLSGPIGVGKSSFAKALNELFDVQRISTRAWILENTGCENERRSLQNAGDRLDAETGGAWVSDAVAAAIDAGLSGPRLLLDSARISGQVAALRERYGRLIFHVHLTAAAEELERRYLRRPPELKEFATYAEASAHGTEAQVGTLAAVADLVLDADHAPPATLAVSAMASGGGISVAKPDRLVDVIVGGQYGSEGKGNVCAHIARHYGALMRIGGPNAGHRVADPPYKYVQLPSGTGSNPEATILIGAGSTIWLPQLQAEIADHNLTGARLAIDPQAIVIEQEDRDAETRGLTAIATTGQGVGAAAARKILNRGDPPLFGPAVRLAREVAQLLSSFATRGRS